MEIKFKLAADDYVKLNKYIIGKSSSWLGIYLRWCMLLLPIVGLLFFSSYVDNPGIKIFMNLVAAIALLYYLVDMAVGYIGEKKIYKKIYGNNDVEYRISIDQKLFQIESKFAITQYKKSSIKSIEEYRQLLVILFRTNQYLILPKTAIKDLDLFKSLLKNFM